MQRQEARRICRTPSQWAVTVDPIRTNVDGAAVVAAASLGPGLPVVPRWCSTSVPPAAQKRIDLPPGWLESHVPVWEDSSRSCIAHRALVAPGPDKWRARPQGSLARTVPIIEAAPPPRHEHASALALMPALSSMAEAPCGLIRGPAVTHAACSSSSPPRRPGWVGSVFDPGQVRLAPRVCYSTSTAHLSAKERSKQAGSSCSTVAPLRR